MRVSAFAHACMRVYLGVCLRACVCVRCLHVYIYERMQAGIDVRMCACGRGEEGLDYLRPLIIACLVEYMQERVVEL